MISQIFTLFDYNLNEFVTFNQALCKPIGNSFIEDTTVLGMVLKELIERVSFNFEKLGRL